MCALCTSRLSTPCTKTERERERRRERQREREREREREISRERRERESVHRERNRDACKHNTTVTSRRGPCNPLGRTRTPPPATRSECNAAHTDNTALTFAGRGSSVWFCSLTGQRRRRPRRCSRCRPWSAAAGSGTSGLAVLGRTSRAVYHADCM